MRGATAILKIPIDPTLAVNHVQVGRAHRWSSIPSGSLSSIKFFLRDSNGEVVDLEDEGASCSFVCTLAPRD